MFAPQGIKSHQRSHELRGPDYRRGQGRRGDKSRPQSRGDAAVKNAINAYLKSLQDGTTNTGTRKAATKIRNLTERIQAAQEAGHFLRAIQLTQERHNAEAESNVLDLESVFIEKGKEYSQKHGISFAAWREFGVPVRALREAGITK